MDLRLGAATPATDDERAAVDSVLGPPTTGWEGGERTAADGHVAYGGHAARARRHLLLPVLHAVQERAGWISPGALDYVCARLTIAPAEAYGVTSFYALFRTSPAPSAVVHVCDDLACQVNGAEQICEQMEHRFGTEGASPESNGAGITWQRSPCLGQCDRGSAAMIQHAGADPARVVLAPFGPDQVRPALTPAQPGTDASPLVPQAGDDRSSLRLLRQVGRVDPGSLDSYRAAGGYEMLRRAVSLGPQGVIRELKDANLLGRGGAAFPTGVKWEAVATNPVQPHYVVCNADESEPGTFKDRVLMEEDPFALLEAITIMGYACGAEQGYLYIRGEYPHAEARLRHAVEQARSHGFLGADVMGEGLPSTSRSGGSRRVHRRRGDRAVQLDRGQAGRTAEQAAVPRAVRPVRQADGHQQRGDAALRAGNPAHREARPSPGSAPRTPPAPGCSACPAVSSAPVCTSSSSGSRCAR